MKNSEENNIGPSLAEGQLQKILSSNTFRNSPVLSAFLKFIAEQTLAGYASQIKEYTIATKALGKPVDFNPATDAVVRIHGGRLRRLLSEYYRSEGPDDAIIITIPKGSYIPVFKDRFTETRLSKHIASANFEKSKEYKKNFQRKVTIAVLPFQNAGGDHSKDYFVNGMGEQLCIDMAKFEHFAILSYYSVFNDKKEKKGTRDLNEMYNADYVIAGNILFLDKIIQVNVQLIIAETGVSVWSHTYTHTYDPGSLYHVQDDIIEQVLNSVADIDGVIIKNTIHGDLAGRREEFGGYYAVYQYYHLAGNYNPQSYRQAGSLLETAINDNPGNALLWSLQAKLFLNKYIFQIDPGSDDKEKGKQYAEKALDFDRNCQCAYKALAWFYLLTGNPVQCREMINRCLEMNPKALSIAGSMGLLLVCLGEFEEGSQLLLKSRNPGSTAPWDISMGLALYYFNHKNYGEAFRWIQQPAIPDFPLKSVLSIATNSKMKDHTRGKINQASLQNLIPATTKESAAVVLNQFIYEKSLRKKLLEEIS